jgi:hypothetical protein
VEESRVRDNTHRSVHARFPVLDGGMVPTLHTFIHDLEIRSFYYSMIRTYALDSMGTGNPRKRTVQRKLAKDNRKKDSQATNTTYFYSFQINYFPRPGIYYGIYGREAARLGRDLGEKRARSGRELSQILTKELLILGIWECL